MPDLKSCPFCGCEMNLSVSGELIAWHRLDPICFLLLLEETEVDMTAEEIHAEFPKAWNRRADNA